MSSTTSRVSLYKPAGGEDVNVTTDLNNNLDKIDTNLNFRVVASATARNAITPFWAGLNVRETDTGKCWVSNGSAPISASWDQIVTANTQTSALNVGAAATGTMAFNFKVGTETNNRFQIRGDGQVTWGAGGGTAPDTNLYRTAANVLKTDDSFNVGGGLTVGGNTALEGTLTVGGEGIYVISDWASLASVGTFVTANGFSAGTPTPMVRKIMYLGTEVWEMKGRINCTTSATGSTIFSFTGGASSPYSPSIEHNFGIPGGTGSSNSDVVRMYWNSAGNVGASTISPGYFTYITLSPFRIVGPLDA